MNSYPMELFLYNIISSVFNCFILIINVYDMNIMLFVVTESLKNEFGTRHG